MAWLVCNYHQTVRPTHANIIGTIELYQNQPTNFQPIGKISQKALRTAWVEFLDQWPWQWFVTLTFRRSVSVEGAEKVFRVFISKINRELFGSRWAKKPHGGIGWVCALEYQRPRDVPHFHALLSNVEDLRRLTWMDTWDELAGYARIQDIRSKYAVRRYIVKYCLKEGEGDIQMGGALSKSAQLLLSQAPRRIPAQPALPFKTNIDAGGEYATIAS